ncbi:hypothetical protein AB0H36_27540 [Kribbella sp. NPDC050820]|uniref:hypothetical protein n=1 Tax=Kribbella sp. NPDC050820 TaxID=3155408 RepID=UPI003403CEAB
MTASTTATATPIVDLPPEDRVLAGRWRYDGEECAVRLIDGSQVTGRTYAAPGWDDPEPGTSPGIRVVAGSNEHWISVRRVSRIEENRDYVTDVLRVGERVRLVAGFPWYGGAYRGALVEITEIEHGHYDQPYNASYLVTPLAPGSAHINIAVTPWDLAVEWFDETPIGCECEQCGTGWYYSSSSA